MPTVTPTTVLDALQRCQVLSSAQLDEVRRDLQPRLPQPQALLGELVRRGWLTRYQGQQILRGRADALILGNYLLLEPLGEGGAGQVFKARHLRMQRVVALKMLRPEQANDPEAVQRFYREIEVVSQLSHPNIVHAYEAGPVGNLLVLVLEYVDGIDLEKLVQQMGPLPVAQACSCIREAAIGLQYAHERGLVHRDIKPSNLLLTKTSPQGNGLGSIKILDLGLARLQQPLRNSKTANLTVLAGNNTTQGTPDYMAPEQALDFRQADIRSDLYSLGCTLYFLLAGQPPFASATLAEKLLKHQQVEPEIESLRADLPPGLVSVLRKLLAKKPTDRYQTPAELAADLQSFCLPAAEPASTTLITSQRNTQTPSPARFPTPPPEGQGRLPALAWKHRKLLVGGLAGGGLAVLLLLLAFVGSWYVSGDGQEATLSPGTVAVRLAVDNEYELYVNGELIGTGRNWEQLQEHTASLQPGLNVIAIKAVNTDGPGGLLAEVLINGKRHVSGPRWKVSNVAQDGWNTIAYNDRQWGHSKALGVYGTGDWQTRVKGLEPDTPAHWIWADQTTPPQTLYFRYTFRTDNPRVASYGADFLYPRPNSGWQYLTHVGGTVGSPNRYKPLQWNTAKGYNFHGKPSYPGPDPHAYLHLERASGHPGRGASQIPRKTDHYAIAAYTIQQADGAGYYRLLDSSIAKGNGLKLLVHVNDQPPVLIRTVAKDIQPPTSFDTDLGYLQPGDTVYVCVGPDDHDGSDSFDQFDFTIARTKPEERAQGVLLRESFDTLSLAWQKSGEANFDLDDTEPPVGSPCFRLLVPAKAPLHYQKIRRVVDETPKPGDRYKATFWVRTRGVEDGLGAYALFDFVDGNRRIRADASRKIKTLGTGDWEQITMESVAPEGINRVLFALTLHAHGTAWFDDVEVTCQRAGR